MRQTDLPATGPIPMTCSLPAALLVIGNDGPLRRQKVHGTGQVAGAVAIGIPQIDGQQTGGAQMRLELLGFQ